MATQLESSSTYAKLATSGPLMALAGLGIVFMIVPESSFSMAYDRLKSTADLKVMGAIAAGCSAIGYYGLFSENQTLWRFAHGVAFLYCLTLSVGFAPPGSELPLLLICILVGCLKVFRLRVERYRALIKILSVTTAAFFIVVLGPTVWPPSQWLSQVGGWTGVTSYAAFAANAWVRMRGTYKEPAFNNES